MNDMQQRSVRARVTRPGNPGRPVSRGGTPAAVDPGSAAALFVERGAHDVIVSTGYGRNGVDESSISIRVRNNVAPQFQSISVPEEAVRPGAAVEVSCSVTDSDGDEISYEWQAGHGAVQGEGASAVWIAPEKPGSYVITVLARDSFGAETRRDVLINVMPGSTPRLGEFGVEPDQFDQAFHERRVAQSRQCRDGSHANGFRFAVG